MRTLDSRVNTTMKVKQDLSTYQKDYQNQKHRHREQRTVKNMRTRSLFSLDFWTLALDTVPGLKPSRSLTENVP